VDELIHKAIMLCASDIHVQPEEQYARVRYRIDGILYDQESLPYQQYAPIISRLKVLAALDIAQLRLPQDGKIRVEVSSKGNGQALTIDLRISTFPSMYGEKMVIRILDRSQGVRTLQELGLADESLSRVKNIINNPHGFFLLTGPTGSGKSTTLYALLANLNTAERNIVTMEDPVEYNISGIMQSQVNIQAGFTFDNGLRCLLRQDPDVMMIGEIRDKTTVQIAIEAALTGHLVVSTLHTNDAPGAITRLIDMGVEPFLINATVTGVLAQRLVRVLCNHCKLECAPYDGALQIAQQYDAKLERLFQARGCAHCRQTGYKGRMGLFELLVFDDQIRDLVIQKASCEKVRQQAIAASMITLAQDGIAKINAGQISFEDFLCVVGQ
jgi:type IV pilus assembly protein PilB